MILPRELRPGDTDAVLDFFKSVNSPWFTPHPLDAENARRVCYQPGNDVYLGLFLGNMMVAYGMVRWAKGYEHPSLGIAVREGMRGRGFGRAMMDGLHDHARRAGATRIMLRVHIDNTSAQSLYRAQDYKLTDDLGRGHLVGWKTL